MRPETNGNQVTTANTAQPGSISGLSNLDGTIGIQVQRDASARLTRRGARRPAFDLIKVLSLGLLNTSSLSFNKPRIYLVPPSTVPAPGAESPGTVAIKPGTPSAKPRLSGKPARLWSTNHTGGRDVSQSPSNLG